MSRQGGHDAPSAAVHTRVLPLPASAIGIPLPVTDFVAEFPTIGTQEEIGRSMLSFDPGILEGSDATGILSIPPANPEALPSPRAFVPFESAPVLIRLPAPVYPEMARRAEVEGTVMVRALVGKNGKVLDAFVTNSVPMLNEAALAAARQAIFKPALQQHKPVAVWVQIPMRFQLD